MVLSKKLQNILFNNNRRKVENDHERPLMNESLIHSDDCSIIRDEKYRTTSRDDDGSNRRYDWKSFHGTVTETTCSSDINMKEEDDSMPSRRKRRSCFDSLTKSNDTKFSCVRSSLSSKMEQMTPELEHIIDHNVLSLPKTKNKDRSWMLPNDINDNKLPRVSKPNNCHFNTSYYSHKNNRPYMEDQMTIESLSSFHRLRSSSKLAPDTTYIDHSEEISFFGIFDGHGGSRASQFCSQQMSTYLVRQKSYPLNLASALRSTYRKMDRDYTSSGNLDGTTACTCVIVEKQTIICANAGDSRAILVRSDGTVFQLSRDHKPGKKKEVERIRKLGGNVMYKGRWRVQGLLSVSRAIGDAALKPYVTSEPDILQHSIGPNDLFLVMASDGIWDALTNEEVASLVLKHSCIPRSNGEIKSFPPNFATTARHVCKQARNHKSKDNLSMVIVDLKN